MKEEQRMITKINGKKFDFDSNDIYGGESPRSERMIYIQYGALTGLTLLLIYWVTGGYEILYKLFRFALPNVSHWVY